MRGKKICFSKLILIVEFAVLVWMLWMKQHDTIHDWTAEICAVIGLITVSVGSYYWKAKSENLVKMPIQMLIDLPEDMREKADPNQIIASVLEIRN